MFEIDHAEPAIRAIDTTEIMMDSTNSMAHPLSPSSFLAELSVTITAIMIPTKAPKIAPE
jgi:hypothetical protein